MTDTILAGVDFLSTSNYPPTEFLDLKNIISAILILCSVHAYGQTDSLFEYFGGVVYLDSITVRASESGFDAADFIEKVKTDESFYRAFKNIRKLSYSADNEIFIKNKNEKTKAAYTSLTVQTSDGDCREMRIDREKVEGDFFKKGRDYRYYTAKLFDRVFYTDGRVCESTRAAADNKNSSGTEKHYRELKKLIFSPGQKADVPFIGKKTAIFSEEMQPFYDYTITSDTYRDGTDCYIFTATAKPEFKADKTVIKHLETWFAKDNFQITARNYRLEYYGLAFDFAVEMQVDIKKIGDLYVPEKVVYDGFFDVPFKKGEYGNFTVMLRDFEWFSFNIRFL